MNREEIQAEHKNPSGDLLMYEAVLMTVYCPPPQGTVYLRSTELRMRDDG